MTNPLSRTTQSLPPDFTNRGHLSKKSYVFVEKSTPFSQIEAVQEDFVSFKEKIHHLSLVDTLKNQSLIRDSGLCDPRTKLFAHLHLSARATNTHFEGLSGEATTNWAKLVFNALQQEYLSKKLLGIPNLQKLSASISQLYQSGQQVRKALFNPAIASESEIDLLLSAEALKIAQEIKNLKPGESYLTEGGYSRSPSGHAMYYKFTKEPDLSYTIVLYNAGEGSNWQSSREDALGRKVNPFVVFSKVKEKELFFSDHGEIKPGIFKSLIELQVLPSFDTLDPRFQFKIEDVWKAFSPLQHRLIEGSQYNSYFMTLQRSGTCAQKSLNACLLDLCQDPVSFKALTLNSQLLSLVNFYHAQKDTMAQNTLEMSQVRFELREAAENLIQKLHRYAKGKKEAYPTLTEKMYSEYLATCLDIIERVDQTEVLAKNDEKKEPFALAPMLNNENLRQTAVENLSKTLIPDDLSPSNHVFYPQKISHTEKTIPPRNVLKAFEKIWLDNASQTHEIEALIKKLPSPTKFPNDPYWSKVSPLTHPNIQNLTKILHYYIVEKTKNGPLSTPIEYQTVLSMIAIMHQLCWRFDQENGQNLLKDVCLDLSAFEDLYKKDIHLLPDDPAGWEKFQKSLEYFRSQNKPGKIIFNYLKNRNVNDPDFKAELNLYVNVLKKNPKQRAKLEKHYLSDLKKSFPDFEFKDLKLLALCTLFEFDEECQFHIFTQSLKETNNAHIASMKQAMIDSYMGLGLGTALTSTTQGLSFNASSNQTPKTNRSPLPVKKQIDKDTHIFLNDFSGKMHLICAGRQINDWEETDKDFLQNAKKNVSQDFSNELLKPHNAAYFERSPNKIKKDGEGASLISLSSLNATEKQLAELAAASIEPRAAVSSLIYQLLQNPSLPESPMAKSLISQVLYSPYFPGAATVPFVPFYEEIKKNGPETLISFQKILERSIKLHFSSKVPNSTDISMVLFYIRLSQEAVELYRYFHGTLPPTLPYSDDLLLDLKKALQSDVNENQGLLAAVSLHRLNCLLTQTLPETRNQEEWEEIYLEWMTLSSYGSLFQSLEIDENVLKKVKNAMADEHGNFVAFCKNASPQVIDDLLNSLSDKLERNLPMISSMLSTGTQANAGDPSSSSGLSSSNYMGFIRSIPILKKTFTGLLASNTSQIDTWTSISPKSLAFKKAMKGGGYIAFDLTHGTISTDEGPLSILKIDTDSPDFKKVFGKRKLASVGCDNKAYFKDDFYGECRMFEEGTIQRKIGNTWFTFVSSDIQNAGDILSLPKALQDGWCYWIGVDAISNQKMVLISSQESGDDRYFINEKGYLKTWPLKNEDVVELLDKEKSGMLADFEEPSYILCSVNESKERSRLEFTRYRTKENQTLSFSLKEKRWAYDLDPNYFIDNDSLKHFSKAFTEFLPLRHIDGHRRKLLIANREINSSGFSTMAHFGPLPPKPASKLNQDKLFSYYEYDVLGEELLADSPDGWIMLSLLYMAEKNYLKADECLSKLTMSDELSKNTIELLKRMIASGPDTNDYSPNASAIRLKAFWILKKLDPFSSGYQDISAMTKDKSAHKNIEEVYRSYLDGLSNVLSPLTLTVEMENDLIGFFEKYLFEKRHAVLNPGKPVEIVERYLKNSPLKTNKLKLANVDALYDYPNDLEEIEQDSWPHRAQTLEALQDRPFHFYTSNFLKDYAVLKNGSENERNELIYRLRWRAPGPQELSSLPLHFENLLHFVITNPNLCPEPINFNASDTEKLKWIATLVKATRDHQRDFHRSVIKNPFSEQFSPDSILEFGHRSRTLPPKALEEASKPSFSLESIRNSPFQPNTLNMPFDQALDALKNQFCKKLEKPAKIGPEVLLEIREDEIEDDDKPFSEVIKSEIALYNDELIKGQMRSVKEAPFKIIEGKEKELETALRELESRAKQESATLEKKALFIARALPVDERSKLKMSLKAAGYRKKEITFMELARLCLWGSLDEYQKKLPELSLKQMQELHLLVLECMAAKTSLSQIERALQSFDEIKKTKNILPAKREALLNAAAAVVCQERQYEPQENLQALFFEFASGLRLRKSQAALFKNLIKHIFINDELAKKGLVFQMIQGGGKSSVILSQLAELISEKGHLTILVSHHSQKNALHGNMKKFQRKRFEKNVVPLNYSNAELNQLEYLNHIEKTLKDAKKNKDTLIVDNTFLPSMQLQLLKLLKEKKFLEDEAEIIAQDAKIEVLQRINRFIQDEAVGLLDEVDLILDILQRVNFPSAQRNFLPSERIHLLKEIFNQLIKSSNEAIVGLSKNEQQDHLEKDYWEKVVPEIAKNLIKKIPGLLLENTSHMPAFTRYVTNSIDKKIEKLAIENFKNTSEEKLSFQEQQDLAFLKYLHHELKASNQNDKKEAAMLIGLSRGILFKILPTTLKKSFNKDYGYDPNNLDSIIPYLAAGVPAKTEFGHVYEHLCYLFQASLNAPVNEQSIKKYIEIMTHLANQYVLQGEKFDETAEAEQFFKLTGVPLADALSKKGVAAVAKKINKNQKLKLEFQTELASRFVSYYPSFLSHSPLAMVDQLRCPIGCSGSVGNKNTYNAKIARLLAEDGVEGKIITTLLERYDEGEKEVKAVDAFELTSFLEKSFDGDKASNLHCLIDGGGLLMRFNPLEVAASILNYFKKKDENQRIKGVILYCKEGDKEGFALLKADSTTPIFLSNTTKEEIEKHGIAVENLFFSLDELRATGSDMPMPENATGIGTATSKDLRHIEQMVMRLRNLFSGQDIGLVITSSAEKNLIGSSKKLIDVLRTAIKNQAIQKSEETFRSFKEQIPHFYRKMLIAEILRSNPKDAATLFEAFTPFLEDTFEDDPFEQFGMIEEKKTPLEIFQDIGNRNALLFEKCLKECGTLISEETAIAIRQSVKKEFNELIETAKELPELRCQFLNASGLNLGLQLHLAQETSQQLANNLSVSLELNEEEKNTKIKQDSPIFQEIAWNFRAVDPWNAFKIGPAIYSLGDSFADYDSSLGWIVRKGLYRTNYSPLFPSHLKMTENLRYTLAGTAFSAFNLLQKPSESVLIRKKEDGRLECIMLSKRDLAFWKEQGETPNNLWILNNEGHLIVASKQALPEKSASAFWEDLDEALWHVNFFNGNVAALIRQPLLSQIFLENNKELAFRYLQNKTAHQPEMKKLLVESSLFSSEKHLSSVRAIKEKNLRTAIEKMGNSEIEKLPPDQVRFIPKEKVYLLKNKEQLVKLLPSQINGVSLDSVNHLSPYQISHLENRKLLRGLREPSLIKRVRPSLVDSLLPNQLTNHPLGVKTLTEAKKIQAIHDAELIEQFEASQMQFLLTSQIPHININCIRFLTKAEHIRALKGRNQINAIDAGSIKYLSADQLKELRNTELILQVEPEQIKYLHPLAIPQLDVMKQLEHLSPAYYKFISNRQYKKLMELKTIPTPLKPLWNRIHPDNYLVYRQILKEAGKQPLDSVPGMNEWNYLLTMLEGLTKEDLAKVKSLSLARPYIQKNVSDEILEIPEEVFHCKNLENLIIQERNTSFLDFGEKEFDFPLLNTLELTSTGIKTFPMCIRKMPNLKKLELTQNHLKNLPTWIEELKNLNYIDLNRNKLSELPVEIGNLHELKYLFLDRNQLISLPDSIGNLIKMEEFELWNNELKTLPESLGNLQKLRNFIVINNQIEKVPFSLSQLSNLERMSFFKNKLTTIPLEFGKLENLSYLSLGENPIVEFPKAILTMTSLSTLDLEGTEIAEIPKEIHTLKHISELLLSATPIKQLPEEIGELENLYSLHLEGTHLTTLPESLKNLKNFRLLNIRHTRISEIPKCVFELAAGTTIKLHGSWINPENPHVQKLRNKKILVDFEDKNIHQRPFRYNNLHPPEWKLMGKNSPDGEVVIEEENLEDLIENDRFYEILQLVNAGLSPDLPLKSGQTLFEWAIEKKEERLINSCLDKGANLEKKEGQIVSPFSTLCRNFANTPDLIIHAAKKIDVRNLTPEEIHDLQQIVLSNKDISDRLRLFEVLKDAVRDTSSKKRLSDRLAARAEKISSRFLKKIINRSIGLLSTMQRAVFRIRRKIVALYRKLFSKNKKISLTEIRFKTRSMGRRLEKEKNQTETLLKKFATGTLNKKETKKITQSQKKSLLKYARTFGTPHVLVNMLLSTVENEGSTTADQVITNLFLDKSWTMTKAQEVNASNNLEDSGLFGIRPHIASSYIVDGMRKAIEAPTLDVPDWIKKPLQEDLLISLERAASWEKIASKKEGIDEVASEFFKEISNTLPNKRVLLPIGNPDHNFLVQVKKTEDGTYTLKVINTGLGISHHARFGEKRYFQTFKLYEKIPPQNILNKNLWKELLELHHTPSKTVDKHYELIEKLAKDGKQPPYSKDRLDYSTAQLQGSCGAAPWWAWLRHEITEMGVEAKEGRYFAYGISRHLKNEARLAILQKVGQEEETVENKIQTQAKSKIEKHGHLTKLLKVAKDPELFNKTMGELHKMILELMPKREIKKMFGDLARDYSDYKNTGLRWHQLHEVSKAIAEEIVQLRIKKRKEFDHQYFPDQPAGSQEEKPHMDYIRLSLLDFETSEKHLRLLFQDAEENKDWSIIGNTLGRLALDHKMTPLAIKLAKQWLILSEKAKAGIVEEKERQKVSLIILISFLWYVKQGKKQEKTLRELAIYFRGKGHLEEAEVFWQEYRKYIGPTFADAIEKGEFDYADISLIANTLTDIKDVTSLLLALRKDYAQKNIRAIIDKLINKALELDDETYSRMKRVTEALYAAGYERLASSIEQKVIPHL